MIAVYSYHDHALCKHQNIRLRAEIRELEKKVKELEEAINGH